MSSLNGRPGFDAGGESLLSAEHCQVAYVTSDIERAVTVFRDRYGVASFRTHQADLGPTGKMTIALAWAGGVMIELIQAAGPGLAFYNRLLPETGFAIRQHHLGYFVKDRAAWASIEQRIEREKWPVALQGGSDDTMWFIYIYAEELGHYLEYMYLGTTGQKFFDGIPIAG